MIRITIPSPTQEFKKRINGNDCTRLKYEIATLCYPPYVGSYKIAHGRLHTKLITTLSITALQQETIWNQEVFATHRTRSALRHPPSPPPPPSCLSSPPLRHWMHVAPRICFIHIVSSDVGISPCQRSGYMLVGRDKGHQGLRKLFVVVFVRVVGTLGRRKKMPERIKRLSKRPCIRDSSRFLA